MNATTSTDHAALVEFLHALAGEAAPESYIELRYVLEESCGMGQVFEHPRRIGELATRALHLGRHTDVYIGCALRTTRNGTREAVATANALWVDCDDQRATDALRRFRPCPSIVLTSGTPGHRHAYWLLTRPLDRDALERANRRIAHTLGGDMTSTDAARILRPPGTYSHKARFPRLVRVERMHLEARYGVRDVVGSLPDPPLPPSQGHLASRRDRDDPLLSIPPQVYVERLLRIRVPRNRKVPCPLHSDEQPSLHVYETSERGWFCFGRCRRGGTIYDLAAALYGYGTRGDDFLALRAELLKLFGLDSEPAR